MQATDLIEMCADYAGILAVMLPVYTAFSKDGKQRIIPSVFPVGLISLVSGIFIFAPPSTPLVARGFVMFLFGLFWSVSFFMLYRRLFTWFTGYQVVCFITYFLLVETFGTGAVRHIILYASFIFSVGLFILIRCFNGASDCVKVYGGGKEL